MSILDPLSLTKYIQEIPKPPILISTKKKHGVDYYEVTLEQTFARLHPTLPLTKLWSFSGIYPPPTLETIYYKPIYVEWISKLPLVHLLQSSLDQTIMGAEPPAPYVRNIIHLHGAETPPKSDGDPNEWYTPGYSITDYYYNEQLPTMLWFHDHAIGITRLNAYAGLSGGTYFIRNPEEEVELNLPSGKYEMPLVLQDRTLYSNGQLFYPIIGTDPTVHPHWVEFFQGNLILVNGIIWPFMNVEPRKYRFRILNSSNSITYALTFKIINGLTSTDLPFYQIGTDGGYLPAPIKITSDLVIINAERMDIVVDFSGLAVGTKIDLKNSYQIKPSQINTIADVMQFNVISLTGVDTSSIRTPKNFIHLPLCNVVRKRQLLISLFDMNITAAFYLQNIGYMAPVTEIPELGTTEIWELINPHFDHPIHLHAISFQLLDRQNFRGMQYVADTFIANPDLKVGDGIPNQLDVTPYLTGAPIPAIGTNEYGWKDTINSTGMMVTRIVARFSPQNKPKFSFDATKGMYVWHCHIIEHEDNDMMRPLQLKANKNQIICRPKTKLRCC